MQAMPLSFLVPGTDAIVTDVRAGHMMHHRLAAMGIFPGSRVSVICTDRGSLIVAVGGTRYALSKGMAMKILVGEGAGTARPLHADSSHPIRGCHDAGCNHHHRQNCRRLSRHEETP